MQLADLWQNTFELVKSGPASSDDADKVKERLCDWLALYRAAAGQAYPWPLLSELVQLQVVYVLPVWQHPDFDVYTNYFRGLVGVEEMLSDPLSEFDRRTNPVAGYYVNPEDVLDDVAGCGELGEPAVVYEHGSPLWQRLSGAEPGCRQRQPGRLRDWLKERLAEQGRSDLVPGLDAIEIGE